MAEEVKRVSLLCAGDHNLCGFVIATALSLPESMKRGGAYKAPPLTEGLLGEENHSSSGCGHWYVHGPNTHVYMGSPS